MQKLTKRGFSQRLLYSDLKKFISKKFQNSGIGKIFLSTLRFSYRLTGLTMLAPHSVGDGWTGKIRKHVNSFILEFFESIAVLAFQRLCVTGHVTLRKNELFLTKFFEVSYPIFLLVFLNFIFNFCRFLALIKNILFCKNVYCQ